MGAGSVSTELASLEIILKHLRPAISLIENERLASEVISSSRSGAASLAAALRGARKRRSSRWASPTARPSASRSLEAALLELRIAYREAEDRCNRIRALA
jgi:hypothetical protein